MIPDIQSSLMCDDVRQERNGKFILIGLFDAITSKTFPVTFPRMCVVNRWCSGEGQFAQVTRLLKPNEGMLMQGKEIPVRLPGPEATATNVEIFINVSFETPGTYWVEILLNNDLKLRYPLRVAQAPDRRPDGHDPAHPA
ncbi:MAG: hypothetical protein HY343_08130 [Lentisphaerae bacterium]|nr:hypothetical protein [Lentisphaerota bacterium]